MAEQGWIEVFVAGTKAGQPVVSGIPMMMVWALALIIFDFR
jgi:simple sugar transport system permease protein